MSTEVLLNEFKEYSEQPLPCAERVQKQGKKVIGMLPTMPLPSWWWPPAWCPWASGKQQEDHCSG